MKKTTIEDLTNWIDTVQPESARGSRFSVPNFFRPYHFAILACRLTKMPGMTVTLPDKFQAYASRMHLWQSIGLPPPTEVREGPTEDNFFPLTTFSTEHDSEDAADAISSIFRKHATCDDQTARSIGAALSEICGNCVFHAETATGNTMGFACAQVWARGKRAQVVVADSGIGIRASLSRNTAMIPRLQTSNAVLVATELGVTGKPEGPHAGYGLTLARQLMEKARNASCIICSGDEAICAESGGVLQEKLQNPWSGTIVALEWDTRHRLSVQDVYNQWPKDDDGCSDDFF